MTSGYAQPVGPPQADPLWKPDRLGAGFTYQTLPLGSDPDGEGSVCATLVRYRPESGDARSEEFAERPAILWVHGMTDYFFAAHVARFLHEKGYAFYAVDLRKCGRSHRPGQRWHYATDMALYYEDLNAAVDALAVAGHRAIIPLAHSTGGLIVALWMDALRRSKDPRYERIPAAVFNSPWLDMMKVPHPVLKAATPLFNVIGKLWPTLPLPGGGLSTFGQSVHRDFYGEWDFDRELKPIEGQEKYVGWVRAILAAQERIRAGSVDIGRPCLTLCSARSALSGGYSPEAQTADTVIDTRQTQHWAARLSAHAEVYVLLGALHEVFLSRPKVRGEALAVTARWLDENVGDR